MKYNVKYFSLVRASVSAYSQICSDTTARPCEYFIGKQIVNIRVSEAPPTTALVSGYQPTSDTYRKLSPNQIGVKLILIWRLPLLSIIQLNPYRGNYRLCHEPLACLVKYKISVVSMSVTFHLFWHACFLTLVNNAIQSFIIIIHILIL